MESNRGLGGEPEKRLNPYESPQASAQRGPLLVRLARATRRGWMAYWVEIRRSELTTVEHLGACLTVVVGILFVAVICLVILALLVTGMLGEL